MSLVYNVHSCVDVLCQRVSWPIFNMDSYDIAGHVLLQDVHWSHFDLDSSGDNKEYDLSCFSWYGCLVFHVDSSDDTDCGLSCFRWSVGLLFHVDSL